MKVILLTDISKVGKRFEVKDVSSGHATNFLIPRGLVVAATKEAVKRLEIEKKKAEGEKKVQEELLLKNLDNLEGKTFTIKEKVNEKGHLFAGLHKEDIVKLLKEQNRIELDPAMIVLKEPIKTAGEHSIEIKVADKSAKIILDIKQLS